MQRAAARAAQLRRKTAGFTLIEILVVVAIIAIFATMIAVNVGGQVPAAKITKTKSDLQTLESAIEQFRVDNGFYPTTEQGLDALMAPPSIGRQARNFRDGGYIKRLPTDPWKNPYLDLAPGMHGEFDIFSYGPDGGAGGEGQDADIGNWNLE